MNSFTEEIRDWATWGKVFHSQVAFQPLTRKIMEAEQLPACGLGELTPGTNGVFRCGKYVVKVFCPPESGLDGSRDMQTELFATARANRLGVAAPQLIASGCIRDKYEFHYMITEFIPGAAFTDAASTVTSAQKQIIGRNLRRITDRLNTPCEDFNGVDVVFDRQRWVRWNQYPRSFQEERQAYLKQHAYGNRVFVHGDINGDNLLVQNENALYLIDFADAVLAPVCYEHALVAAELFHFDSDLCLGYFGEIGKEALTNLCFEGLMIHDFGGDIIRQNVAKPAEMNSLSALRKAIAAKIPEAEKMIFS